MLLIAQAKFDHRRVHYSLLTCKRAQAQAKSSEPVQTGGLMGPLGRE